MLDPMQKKWKKQIAHCFQQPTNRQPHLASVQYSADTRVQARQNLQ